VPSTSHVPSSRRAPAAPRSPATAGGTAAGASRPPYLAVVTGGKVISGAPVAPADSAANCPYCALLLDPPPERGRLCPRCRRPIVVRRVNGRRVLLTKEALDVFESERERETNERNWTSERRRWLTLARSVAAPEKRAARIEAAAPSQTAVDQARELYLGWVDRATRAAKRARRWTELARIKRDQAAALFRAAGSPVPPPDDIVALHREWSAAALKAAAGIGADAELVSGGCCSICSKDDGKPFRITVELRAPRLPHAGCPRGLCACDWYPLPDSKTPGRRRKKAAPGGSANAGLASGAALSASLVQRTSRPRGF
jgi:hypothetical protein